MWAADHALSQEAEVPPALQAELFAKILTFDRELPARVGKEIVVGIVYQGRVRASLDARYEFEKGLHELSDHAIAEIPTRCVATDLGGGGSLEAWIEREEVDILYVAPLRAVSISDIASVTRARRVTTLAAVPAYAELGLALSLGMRGGRPLIIVNLPAARAEGSDFSSQLLKLAKIVGTTDTL